MSNIQAYFINSNFLVATYSPCLEMKVATRAVNMVQWSVDDIRVIAFTIFIQRARG